MAKVKIITNIQSKNKSGNIGEKSLKSQRTYQLGVVYKDIYGRETPVFTNSEASFTVPKRLCDKRNSIITSVENDIPSWVDTFKFFVKETSNEYYNACMDRWYDAEDGNIWLSFPSAERNKIKEDGFIILKKQAIDQNAVYEEARYKVIDVQNEAPDFIKTDYEMYGTSDIQVIASGAKPGAKKIVFDFDGSGSNDWNDSVFFDELLTDNFAGNGTATGFVGWPLESVVIKLSSASGGASTKWLDVASMYTDNDPPAIAGNLYVELSKTLPGVDADGDPGVMDSIIPDSGSAKDVTVKIAKKVVKNKAEFDGKFFVKIRRDTTIDERVRSMGIGTPNITVTHSIDQYYIDRGSGTSSNAGNNVIAAESFWTAFGENWFIDKAQRKEVGSQYAPSTINTKGPFKHHDGFGIEGDNLATGREALSSLGAYRPELESTLELTLNRIKDDEKDGYDTSGQTDNNQNVLAKLMTPGTMFRWKEDPFQHIYRITRTIDSSSGVNDSSNYSWLSGLLNYSSHKQEREVSYNKAIRLYLNFQTTGWRRDLDGQSVAASVYRFYEDDEAKFPFGYKNDYDNVPEYTGVTDPWDPTKRGYGEYQDALGDPEYATSGNASILGGLWQSINSGGASGSTTPTWGTDEFAFRNTLEIVEISRGEQESEFTRDPAIWETEPREDVGLDIYHEASQAYPVSLTDQTNELFAPYGCEVTCVDAINNKTFYLPSGTTLYDWAPTGHGGDTLLLGVRVDEVGIIDNEVALSDIAPYNPDIGPNSLNTGLSIFAELNLNYKGLELQFTNPDGSYTTAKIKYYSGWYPGQQVVPNTSPPTYVIPPNLFIDGTAPVYPTSTNDYVLIKLDRDLTNSKFKLPYFNCYSFGNGVESDRIRDDFNAVRLDKGVKVSTVLDEPYEEEQRTNGLIYSGIYNSNSGVNNLNQFIGAEKITKDVNPSYGSIQKLKTRDTNLVAFCEDKVLKIVANKDALYNADGKPQLIASNAVLGDVTTFAGEFGISKNPESFAEEAFRMYFTDKQRGKVLRLSGDGITPISSVGMKDYFADNLKHYKSLIGSFDDRKGEYNLTMTNEY